MQIRDRLGQVGEVERLSGFTTLHSLQIGQIYYNKRNQFQEKMQVFVRKEKTMFDLH